MRSQLWHLQLRILLLSRNPKTRAQGFRHPINVAPEKTALHEIVRENLEPFLQYTRENYKNPLPKYVEKELRRYLTCGMLSEGFTRIRCPGCGKDMIVAFSCGSRTVCSSCAGRRMAASAMHLVDKVLPDCPVRMPTIGGDETGPRLRFGLWYSRFRRIRLLYVFIAEYTNPKTGMLTIMQRFGGSLNFNPHVHGVGIDGAYSLDEDTGLPRFHFQAAPTHSEIQAVTQNVHDRTDKPRVQRVCERNKG